MQKIMFDDRYRLTGLVLEGYKKKTRRMIPKRTWKKIGIFQNGNTHLEGKELIEAYFAKYPKDLPYKPGEIVAVAQSYRDCGGLMENGIPRWEYIAKQIGYNCGGGWSNKMFVKPELMPRQIRMGDYKVERLQDISDENCLKEGIEKFEAFGEPASYIFFDIKKSEVCPKGWCLSPREAFASLIDKVSGKGTWESNPFVLAYDFELVR